MVDLSRFSDILLSIGWLAIQPPEFQEQVFERSAPVRYTTGDVIFRPEDPPGGMYGIVKGTVVVTVGPKGAEPRVLHVMSPGGWTGESTFLSRQPRRLGLTAATETTAIHLPLEQMDSLAGRDPMATRRFTQCMMLEHDLLTRAFYDLLDPDEYRRVARSLRRIAVENTPIPIGQSMIGMMSNVSRKTANFALRRFAGEGWLETGYRSITVRDLAALTRFAESETG